jgi:hypothetical protein
MTSTTIAAVIVVVALGAGVAYRYSQIRIYPVGVGWNMSSPNGRYRAFATTFFDRSFFGRHTAFYGFEIEDCTEKRTVVEERTPPMPESEAEELGSEACIHWSPDSRSVRVVVGYRTLWEYEISAEPITGANAG